MTLPFIVTTAWTNGRHGQTGSGYGLKVSSLDRDAFLDRSWRTVEIRFPDGQTAPHVNVDKASLWEGECRELIHNGIGKWLIRSGLAPWPKGAPPRIRLVRIADRIFEARPSS